MVRHLIFGAHVKPRQNRQDERWWPVIGEVLPGFLGPPQDLEGAFDALVISHDDGYDQVGQRYRAYPSGVCNSSAAVDQNKVEDLGPLLS